ncbi:MAG TPA: DUF1989 domain-containing protein, partial [Methylophaga aminisulfidivorans]|nr:DUF1989 domain-containing protein [Methylophaga aminisulfidivorans]
MNRPEQTVDDLMITQPIVNTSQYRIGGQKAIKLDLNQGDSITITSLDGVQSAEVIVINRQGEVAPHLLGNKTAGNAEHILQQLAQSGSASLCLRSQFEQWQVSNDMLQKAICLAGEMPETLVAKEAISLVVVAAGADMSIDQHQPATELHVSVDFAEGKTEILPAPLADIKAEYRVKRATALTYEVKKGEWIQVIDVSGKQCSDFIAFDKKALDKGKEVGLDPTATRTIMGVSNPIPGLHSRFLGPDMLSMVEVVQDTVGRHDSFMFACTPKFYEDSGYFGHVSCTDNFNRVLAPYGIAPRAGWPAINLFFNTEIGACGTVFMDEPWSRAGDYVLIRADRDLLCGSSACPDDIDSSNGWNPTDIHVRIYGAENEFPRSIAHRTTPEELPRMTKFSGFHHRVSALTTKLTEYAGYWVASEYNGWGATAEYLACRERVALL